MDKLSYPDLVDALKNADALSGPEYKVGILSNITVHPLQDILGYSLSSNGVHAEISTATYDNIVQEASNYQDANVVFVFWEVINFIQDPDALRLDFAEQDYVALLDKVKTEIQLCFGQIGAKPLIMFNRFSSLALSTYDLNPGYADRLVRELNYHLESLASEMKNVFLVELDKLISSFGLDKSFNWRFYKVSKTLYSYGFLFDYIDHLEPVILNAFGKAKKVLVLDCDNTLWKGVVGEDGVDGIKMYSGAQRYFAALAKRGIVVCLCSKNNPEDVDEVLERRTDMLLTDDHIVLKKVGWGDKVVGIGEIADELNLGLDSFVFLDDSDFEVNLVKESLPMVSVFKVPQSEAEYKTLAGKVANIFFNLNYTAEDVRKTAMYKVEAQRNEARSNHSSMEDFLHSLELGITVYVDDKTQTPRFAQLTQKTNQFNLTTKRYLESDIEKMIESPECLVVGVAVQDRFGDSGLSGLAVVEIEDDRAIIDSFMLSCRVLGRRIEYKLFEALVELIQRHNISQLQAEYRVTAKNSQVSDFWPRLGFGEVNRNQRGDISYVCDSDGVRYPDDISFIKVAYE